MKPHWRMGNSGVCCDAKSWPSVRDPTAFMFHAMHSYMLFDIEIESVSLAYSEWEETSASADVAVATSNNESSKVQVINDWSKSLHCPHESFATIKQRRITHRRTCASQISVEHVAYECAWRVNINDRRFRQRSSRYLCSESKGLRITVMGSVIQQQHQFYA